MASDSEADTQQELLQKIVDGQKETIGLEKTHQQAENAGITLDDEGTITDLDKDVQDAIDALRYEITGKEPDDGAAEIEKSERQEYYLASIRDIVEEQRDLFGDDIALKQAHQAPLKIDEDSNVTGFYGRGEDALAILRSFTEHQSFYLEVIQAIINRISTLFGQRIALGYARQSPLEIAPEGHVKAYYGKGRQALTILMEQIESDLGNQVADNQMRSALREKTLKQQELLPDDIRPTTNSNTNDGLLARIKSFLGL